MRAGRLRQRVDVLRLDEVDDGKGGYVSAWTPIASDVPAEVIGLTGREAVLDRVLQGIRVYQVTTRWRDDVGTDAQLRYGTEIMNVRSAVDPDGRRDRLIVIADTAATLPDV